MRSRFLRGSRRSRRSVAARRRGRRLVSVLVLAGLMLMLGAQGAEAETISFPAIPVAKLAGFVTSLAAGSPHWDAPEQETGTAAGEGHEVPASVTRAGQGAGRAPGNGKGALPAYASYQRPSKQGPSRTVTGFSAKTSRRDAAKSTATSDYYVNADGSVTKKMTVAPVNYKDGSSGYEPIDTRVQKSTGGRWAEKANSLSVNFAPSSSASDLVSFAADSSHGVSYGLRGAASVTGTASGSTVTYPGIEPGTDLAVEPTPTGLKESIVLHSAQAGNSWVFPLDLKGLTPKPGQSGAIDLVDGSGKTVEEIPPAYAYDSKVNPKSGDPATTYAVSYRLETSGGKTSLAVTLDPKWLASPDRVFPVTVDPTMTDNWQTTYAESGVTAGDHSSEQSIKIGSYDAGTHDANSFISTWYDSFGGSGATVSSASLSLYDSWASICTPERFDVAQVTSAWTPTSVTSYPGPSYGPSIGNLTPNVPDACANTASDRSVGDWVTVPLSKTAVQAWADGTTKDLGLAVYGSTTDDLHWKQFGSFNDPGYQPYLSVTYTGEVAPQIYQQYPRSGAVAYTRTPEFSAIGLSPAGSTLKYDFQVYDDSGTKVVDSGLVTTQNWTAPAGKLAWGSTYYWTVQAYDGTDYSAAPPWSSVTVQVKQPLITSGLAQNGNAHGFDPSIGNYTTSDTDADISGAGPALQVVRDYNSRDPRWTGAFGQGWSSVLDARVAEQHDPATGAVTGVVVTYPDGSEVGFGKNSDGSFSPPEGRFATLKAVTGGYTLTDKNDTVYTFTQSLASGTYGITSVADANARALDFTWSGGQVTTMSSAVSGRSLHLAWATPAAAAAAHVASVTSDPVTSGDTSTALTWTYGYAGDQLSSVCDPGDTSPKCESYSYASGSQYQNAALDLGAQSYWPMSESSGTAAKSAVLANEGADNATYSNVTLGQAGPLTGSSATAAGFNGTSSLLKLPQSLANATDSQSISLWFKTSAGPGVLFSYNSQPMDHSTLSGFYTPSIYVGSDGKLNAEFWYSAGIGPIQTSSSVADGKWHHVVLSAAGSTQTLYLDGKPVGSKSGQVSIGGGVTGVNQGYTQIGAGYLGGGWPDQPYSTGTDNSGTASYFKGSIADVGFYAYPLAAADVTALYGAGTHPAALLSGITRPSGKTYAAVSYNPASAAVTKVTDENGGTWNLAAPAVTGSSQVYRGTVLGAAPRDYWRLGDTAGASVAANEVNGGTASYNAVTLGASGPFADETAASFNGSSSYATLPSGLTGPAGNESVSLWFKTTTANGILLGSSLSPLSSGTASSYVPMLYVGSDGKLNGEFYDGTTKTAVSAAAVTDGKWHEAVLASSATSRSLYLDGKRVSTVAGTIRSTSNEPYLYAGTGMIGGSWPDNSHSGATVGTAYFKGSIAEIAYYPGQLTQDQVTAEYQAGGQSQGLSPVWTAKVTDPGSKTLTYQYDPLNGYRELSETDGLGHKTSIGYDTGGFQHTVTDPDGDVTVTDHDSRGNVVSATSCQDQAAGKCSTQYFTYYPDDTSAQLTTADPRNDLPLTMRDGRSASATDNTYLTSYGYDSRGNETTETTPAVDGSPDGRTTTTTYSDGTSAYPAADSGNVPAGLPVKTVSPGGAVTTVSYFQDGDVAKTVDPDWLETDYEYDGIGRVTKKTVVCPDCDSGSETDDVTTYQYDANSNVVKETAPQITDSVTGAQHIPVTKSVFDSDGNMTSQTVSDAGAGGDAPRTESWTFNQYDQEASDSDANASAGAANGGTATFEYDSYGNKSSEVDPDGSKLEFSYDPDGNLLTQTLDGYTGDPVNPSSPQNLVESSRAYDPAGRLATLTDSMGNVNVYKYTDDGLVASVTRTDKTGADSYVLQSNTYDAAGNLTAQATDNGATVTDYTVDAADRTTSTTVDPSGTDRTTTVDYTPDDEPATVTESGPSGNQRVSSYTYDPMGNELSESVTDPGAGGPAASFPLTQSSGDTVTDSVTGGQTGTAKDVTWNGTSAGFSGGSQISTGGPVADTTGSFTVSAWVNLAGSTDSDQDVVSQSAGTDAGFYLKYNAGTGGWQFMMPQDDTSDSVNSNTDSSSPAATGTWTFLTGVYDVNTGYLTLYVNGDEQDSAANYSPVAADGPLMIGSGQYGGAVGASLDGQVSDVQVYPRALSGDEVSSLYGLGQGGGDVTTGKDTTTWTRDARGLPASETDPDGNTSYMAHDAAGNLVQEVAPAVNTETGDGQYPVSASPVTSFGYDTFGEQTETEDPDGNVVTDGFDADGNQVSQVEPDYTPPGAEVPVSGETDWTYDSSGQQASQVLPDGEETEYEYDQLGDQAQVTQPDGSTVHTTFDTDGDPLSVTDGTGAVTEATYDWMGRQVTGTTLERYPTAQTLTTHYSYAASSSNPDGAFLASETTPDGMVTSYGHDNLGEQISVTDGAGNTTQSGFDDFGDQNKTTLPDGTYDKTGYDTSGDPVSTGQYDSSGTLLAQSAQQYDQDGNAVASIDPDGHAEHFLFDASGAMTAQVQPVSADHSIVTSFGHDAALNQTRYTDGRGNNWYTTYNALNLPATQVEPATDRYSSAADSTTTFGYNGDGQLTDVTQPGGVRVSMDYDQLGDLKEQSGTGADAATAARSFTYDADGRVKTAATEAAGTAGDAGYQAATSEAFSYDDRGDLLSASGSAGSSSFGYNGDGLMTSRSDAAGTTGYSYDGDDRLKTLDDASTGTQLTYSYNSLSQVKGIQYGSSGQDRTFTYNSRHELTGDTLAQGDTTLASVTYGYDGNGNLTSKDTTGVAGASDNTYSYDWANRLTSWDNGTSTTDYGYDDSGNRVQVGSNVYTYDARDELTSDGVNSYSYTARGTLSSESSSAGGTSAFTADAFGQQVTAGTESYGLDALGRDLTDTDSASGGTARTLAYSGADNLVTSDGAFTYSYDPDGGLTGINTAGAADTSTGRLALTDQHDDVVGTFTSGATSLSGSATYDPLGNVTASSDVFGQLGYQSGWTDSVTGKVNMGSRWYNPAAGQFMNKDTASVSPVPDEAAANPFAYVGDNPMIGTDADGHCSWWDVACAAKAVVKTVKKAATAVKKAVVKVYHAVVKVVKKVVVTVKRVVSTVVHYVSDAYHAVVHYASSALHTVGRTVKKTAAAVVHKISAATLAAEKKAKAVAAAAKAHAAAVLAAAKKAAARTAAAAAKYAKAHAAAITSFVVSTAVFAGCEAVTAGAGTIGCAALSGAAGSLVTQGFKCADDGGSACSLESFGEAGVEGAVEGAMGGVLGEFGGALLGKLAPKALDAVGGLFSDSAGEAAEAGLDEAAGDAGDAAAGGAGGGGDAGGGGGSGGDEPVAGTEEDAGGSCTVPHSFTGGTRVLMADGTSKPIDQVRAGDKIADSVPGQKGTQVHTVSKVIVTKTDHDFVDVTVAPVKVGAAAVVRKTAKRAGSALGSAAKGVKSKAKLGLAAAVAVGAVAAGGQPAMAATAPAHGGTITTTFHHPFYDETQAAFVEAQHLHAGDVLQTPTGTAKVAAVRLFHADTVTYDLTIGTLHTYYVVAGGTPVLVHNVNDPGCYTSVYRMKLDKADFGKSRPTHFRRANAALLKDIQSDPELRDTLSRVVAPDLEKQLTDYPARAPRGWVWNHALSAQADGESGVMELVPLSEHTPGSPWWRVLHPGPNGAGGYSEWAIPAGAPRN